MVYAGSVVALDFASDGRLATTSDDGALRLYMAPTSVFVLQRRGDFGSRPAFRPLFARWEEAGGRPSRCIQSGCLFRSRSGACFIVRVQMVWKAVICALSPGPKAVQRSPRPAPGSAGMAIPSDAGSARTGAYADTRFLFSRDRADSAALRISWPLQPAKPAWEFFRRRGVASSSWLARLPTTCQEPSL